MVELDFQAFDADNHYYEAEDAFTRHIDSKMAKRCMQWATINGKKRLLVGGRVNKFIPNPTFDPIARPGSLEDYFRGRNLEGKDLAAMFGDLEPLSARPGYRDRAARVELLDEQGLEAALLFPTLGVGMQQALRHDVEALHAAFSAFNSWLDEDWGFDRGDGRLYAAPMLALSDPERAVAEVERVIGMGARIVCMIPGPVPVGDGYQSPGLPDYDPVWARLQEAGVAVAVHAGLTAASQYNKFWERGGGQFEGFRHSAFPLVAFADRGVSETFAALICHGAMSRFPDLRWATIENGAMWVPDLLRNLAAAHGKMPYAFSEHPVEQFKRSVWVSPFYEDDIPMLADVLGIERIMFGSDFPHAEGLKHPLDFVHDVPSFTPEQVRKVMRENVRELLAV